MPLAPLRRVMSSGGGRIEYVAKVRFGVPVRKAHNMRSAQCYAHGVGIIRVHCMPCYVSLTWQGL